MASVDVENSDQNVTLCSEVIFVCGCVGLIILGFGREIGKGWTIIIDTFLIRIR